MTVIFVVLPLAVFFSAAAVAAFLWSTRSGQLDDLETPPLRVLHDDARPAYRVDRSHRDRPAPGAH